MSTIHESMISYLESNGMSIEDATKVMDHVYSNPLFPTTKGNWNNKVAESSEMAKGLAKAIVRAEAYHWVMDNHPKAWYAPVFCFSLYNYSENCDIESFLNYYMEIRAEELVRECDVPLATRMVARLNDKFKEDVTSNDDNSN